MFASGKTFTLEELLQLVQAIKADPDKAKSVPDFQAKLDWLFAHFDHQLDFDEWAQTLPAPPTPTAYQQLLLSHPDWLEKAITKAIGIQTSHLDPQEIPLSSPHEAYLRLHAARLELDESQTQTLINQQKLASAAKAVDDLKTQGITDPDKYQIQQQIRAKINDTNTRTASLQREVLHHDTRITDQLDQSFQRVINSQPTTIPQSEITAASRELASLSYQTLKPSIPLVSSPADLVNILKDRVVTTERISHIPTLSAYKIPPHLFHQALEAVSNNLFNNYIEPARNAVRTLEIAGEYDYHHVSSTTPPPQIPTHTDARDMFWAQGYPGETIINASNPHALENYLAHTPKTLLDIATAPIRLIFGPVETGFISLYLTRNRETVQVWSLNRVMPLLPSDLQNRWQAYWSVFQTTKKHDLAAFQSLFQDTQTWIRDKTRALHEGNLKVSFDTREKILEANNNLNVLEFSEKYRALLEKIPGVKQLLNLWSNSIGRFNPIYASYLKAWLGLAFRSDPLTAGYLLIEYGAIRPAIAGLWKSAVVPLTRHLPFGWDVKQGLFGKEVYWKPAKWAKDNLKQGLGWLAEKTGIRRAGEWIAQKIFKTTFAKLAAVFGGLATGFLIAWGALKKSIKATAGLLFLFLITHGLPTALAAAIGGGLTAFFAAGLATTGLVLLGVTSPLWLAVAAVVTFAIVLPLAALFWGFMYLKSIGALSALGSWLAGAPAWASEIFASLGSITLPTLPTWVFATATATVAGIHLLSQQRLNTAMMAPALGGITGYPGTLPGGIIIPGPGGAYPTCWPSEGRITQGPGCDLSLPGGGSHCTGFDTNSVDIAGFTGQPVYATHDGTATAHTDLDSCYGNYVTITSPLGFTSYYAHLQQASFTGTIDVTAGTIIGYEDASTAPGCFDGPTSGFGPHLHYELRGLDLALPYIPHLAAAGLSTTGCFASQAGGSSVPPQPPPLQPPPPTPPTPFPTSCQTFGGTCVSSGQCPVPGCGIAGPVGGWTDCKSPAACCDTTGIVSSQCATSTSPSSPTLPSLTSCDSRDGICTPSTGLGCPGGNSCRIILPSSYSSWTDCQTNEICCNNTSPQCQGP